MDTASKRIVWAFAVLGIISVALTFYKSVVIEDFTVAYCDEEGNCYKTMPEEWLEEETNMEADEDIDANAEMEAPDETAFESAETSEETDTEPTSQGWDVEKEAI